MQMMLGFWIDDVSNAYVFEKEFLPIVAKNIIKIGILWRAGNINNANI